MKSSRLFSGILLLFLTFFFTQIIVRAEDEADEYDVTARVVRISLITGEVNLKRKGNADWEQARLNFPLVEGDTLATGQGSRLEIQVDARNFLRLAANTTIQIVALRDEGVAVSVIEGTTVIRLARFDRQREYFEVDAPRTTMAAERTGLFRIDVPSDGRVRFTVRDGGSARIYSDTSGFALRDGRTAELIVSGANAGDWDFIANAPVDAIDDWVSDREHYLAQRLRYNTQYYDEYVWGAEDLDAYGDWSYTSDFGWIWSPYSTVINTYADWAPYRYGHWVWCPPYGWTWVGYEPWGWAPYHYGRWVYHKGRWAWCPRSAYSNTHSWWRPALVAFVSIGNDYCWYPLDYHQRDPRSRHYDRPGNPPRPWTDNPPGRRHDPIRWHGVTSCHRDQFGNDTFRPRRADERLARRAVDSEPVRTGWPQRPRNADVGERGEIGAARPTRNRSEEPSSGISTGAGTRRPGVPLDDELRRIRVFNGRQPRPEIPAVNPSTSGSESDARPTGAITRPIREPRDPSDRGDRGDRNAPPRTAGESRDRRPSDAPANPDANEERPANSQPATNRDSGNKPVPGRIRIDPVRPRAPLDQSDRSDSNGPSRTEGERPDRRLVTPTNPGVDERPPVRTDPNTNSDAGDKPTRGRVRIEPVRPERNEAPAPTGEAPRQRNEPPPRVDSPRRNETPPQRSEPPAPRTEPPQRTEVPRSEPPSRPSRPDNYEPREQPSRSESPRAEPNRSEAPRSEPSRSESPRSQPTRSESPRSEPSRSESPRSEPSRSESPRSEPSRSESPRSEPSRSESPRSEPSRSESPRSSDPDTGRPGKPDKPRR